MGKRAFFLRMTTVVAVMGTCTSRFMEVLREDPMDVDREEEEEEEDSLQYSSSASEDHPPLPLPPPAPPASPPPSPPIHADPTHVARAISVWRRCTLRKLLPETFFTAVDLMWRYQDATSAESVTESVEDACILLAVKFVESTDRPVPGLATRRVIAAEARVAKTLDWRIWRDTLFDRIADLTKSEPLPQVTRLAALAVMLRDEIAAGALRESILRGIGNAATHRLARVAIVMHYYDVVRAWRGRIMLAIPGNFLSDAPFHAPTRVFAEVGRGDVVRAFARHSAIGIDLDTIEEFAAARLASKSLIWWRE